MKIHHLQGYIQSIYLVEYPDRLLLLDGCCRADVPMLRDFITTKLNRPVTDLVMVVVTHMHPDHAGAAHTLRKLTGCRIASANVDYPWYKGVKGMIMQFTDIALAHWVASRMNKPKKRLWFERVLKPDIRLKDGEALPGFDDWQVIETPGHTDRDLSIMHTLTQRIYVADLVVKVKKRFIPPFPISFPREYHKSIAHLRSLKPASVMLAHGGEVELSAEDYQHLFASAPNTPQTPWRTVGYKLKKVLSR